MKLADSWTWDVPAPADLGTFHDEGEEVDEAEKAKDGCGAWVGGV